MARQAPGGYGGQQGYNNQPWLQPGFTGSQVAAGNASMPSWLQISPNWGAAAGALASKNYMTDIVNPTVASQYANDNANGAGNSTFAAARGSSMQTMGARQAMLAGIDAQNGAVDRMLRERESYNSVPYNQNLPQMLNNNYQYNQQTNANRTAGYVGAGLGLANSFGQAAGWW